MLAIKNQKTTITGYIAVAGITEFAMKGTGIFCLLALIMALVLLVIVPKMEADIRKTSLSDVSTEGKAIESKSNLENGHPLGVILVNTASAEYTNLF